MKLNFPSKIEQSRWRQNSTPASLAQALKCTLFIILLHQHFDTSFNYPDKPAYLSNSVELTSSF